MACCAAPTSGDASKGAKFFKHQCSNCHNVNPVRP